MNNDRWNRPVIGEVNINEAYIETDDFDYFFSVLLHECIHTFGFSSYLYDYFRDENEDRYGSDEVTGISTLRDKEVYYFKTPRVVEELSRRLGCEDPVYPELEDYGSSGTVGSH